MFKTKKTNLEKITVEGFITTHSYFGDAEIYKKDNERVVYDSFKDKIVIRYELKYETLLKRNMEK